MNLLVQLLSFFVSVLSGLVFTRMVRSRAVARGWVVAPASERHLHREPLPRLGGIAILISFCLVTASLVVLRLLGVGVGISLHRWIGLLGPAALVFGVGVYDDFCNAKPWVKFGAQACGAAWLYAAGYSIQRLPILLGDRHLGPLVSFAATLFWVLLITNAFNLIDGLDGLAAGSALFSTIVVFVVALLRGDHFVAICTLALAGAILGFLRFNFHPASIFLGDCGSLFIGFMLSALGLASSQKSPTMIAVGVPVVACGLPVLETGLSVARRFLNRRPLFGADREHIHHKLLARGFSQRQAVAMLYAVSAGFALVSLLLINRSGAAIALVLVVLAAVASIGLERLGYHEVSELQRVAQRTIEQKKIISNNLSIRRATEKLKACARFDQICEVLEEAFDRNEFDRFELEFPLGRAREWPRAAGERLQYEWENPGSPADVERSWSLSLQLAAGASAKQGTFVLYRSYRRSPLQLDVNLLMSSFHAALAGALERATDIEIPAHVAEARAAFSASAS